MSEQARIDIEIEAIGILRRLVACSEIPFRTTGAATDWLLERGYIVVYRSQYVLTEEGREFYREASEQPRVVADTLRWKEEALTGLRAYRDPQTRLVVSAPSKIENAAIPGNKPDLTSNNNPEEMVIKYQTIQNSIRKIANELGLDPVNVANLMNEGRIRKCSGGHIGIFDKKGNGWQHLCRKCRKVNRNGRQ